MSSEFEINTLVEIAILKVAVTQIMQHLSEASADPRSFLARELKEGLEALAKTNYWSVSHKTQKDVLKRARAGYSELIENIRPSASKSSL